MAYSGEPVTQLQHALQTAALAEQAGAATRSWRAALLHDLGHLLNLQGETPSERGIDDLHQYFALPFLRPLFSDAVLEPIRLHVDAKRCLCAIDAGVFRNAVRRFRAQPEAARRHFQCGRSGGFMSKPFAEDAMSLRRWDDLAKQPDKDTPAIDHYMRLIERLSVSHRAGW